MFRRSKFIPIALVAASAVGARAQTQTDRAPDPVETYLADRGLDSVLSAYMRERLNDEVGRERIAVATRLARLYAALLDKAATHEKRAEIEAKANELLAAIPAAETHELRLNLAKARYLIAETQAENHRLRLASVEERREAEATLRAVQPVFQQIGQAMHLRVGTLERAEAAGSEDEALKNELREARRLRSLAMYYAGWSEYFLGLLSGLPSHAAESLKYFGWILNSTPGQPASPDALAPDLLAYDHVARAALGAALAESLRGSDVTAMRWLDLIDESDKTPPAIRATILSRRIAILSGASRWSDLDLAVTQHLRAQEKAGGDATLSVRDARLLAVAALEALTRDNLPDRARPLVEQTASGALAALVERGETWMILDLVRTYGSAQLGASGFIVDYVRGLHAFDLARNKHDSSGEDPAEPTRKPDLATEYRAVAASMRASLGAPDAKHFPRELAQAGRVVGLSLLYAGELVEASHAFERAYADAADRKQAEELLWLALASLDMAVKAGATDLDEHHQRVAAIYVQSFPGTDRAASLVLRSLASGVLSDAEAIDVLLAVPSDSPLAHAARRQAGQLLYKQFRSSAGRARDAAADRYVLAADETLRREERDLDRAGTQAPLEEQQRLIDMLRQYLDVVLGTSTPDVARARAAMQMIEKIERSRKVSIEKIAGEFAYRRLQIALIEGDESEIARAADDLRAEGDRYAELAANVLFKRALELWRAEPDNMALAREVVRYGSEAAARVKSEKMGDPAASILDAVAEAADAVYVHDNDEAFLSAAIEADRAIIDSGRSPPRTLRRLARLAEAAGEQDTALDMWRRLSPGLASGTPEWFEARYHVIRLLARTDLARAHQAMAQHKVLYPDPAPGPWAEKFAQLDADMVAARSEGRDTIDKEPPR